MFVTKKTYTVYRNPRDNAALGMVNEFRRKGITISLVPVFGLPKPYMWTEGRKAEGLMEIRTILHGLLAPTSHHSL
ncbi:MAG: hypothetical protein JWL80_494 [Parcubacteria group bacterium]|nr:hypothetical protein [Parcubacteria group bacterium]